MPAQIVQLREALKTQVESILDLPEGTVIESRRVMRTNADELESLHLVFFVLDLNSEVIARGIDKHEFTIGLAVQQKVSGGDETGPVDGLLEIVDTIRTLWEPEGELREIPLANCQFKELIQSDLFEPRHLLNYGVFTAILELTYSTEIT